MGRKMSKSYGNTITLSETDEEIRKKTKVMVTDPARKRRTDPGNPDVCPVYDWHKLFSVAEPGRLEWVRQGCTTAGIGCIECKAAMAENLIKWIAPVRERRVKYEKNPKQVLEIWMRGRRSASCGARTMQRVREAVFGWEKKKARSSDVRGKELRKKKRMATPGNKMTGKDAETRSEERVEEPRRRRPTKSRYQCTRGHSTFYWI